MKDLKTHQRLLSVFFLVTTLERHWWKCSCCLLIFNKNYCSCSLTEMFSLTRWRQHINDHQWRWQINVRLSFEAKVKDKKTTSITWLIVFITSFKLISHVSLVSLQLTLTLFVPLVPFQYPLKTSGNQKFSDVFRGYWKRPGA